MQKAIIITVLAAIILMPVIAYSWTFGVGLWSDHEDWARMGSFFGGTLGPIVTSISLVFLAIQIKLQVAERREYSREKRLTRLEDDVFAFIPKLAGYLSDEGFINKLNFYLLTYKDRVESNKLEEGRHLMRTFMEEELQAYAIWEQIDGSLRRLYQMDQFQFGRMRAHILSECDVNKLAMLDLIRSNMREDSLPNSLFPEQREI